MQNEEIISIKDKNVLLKSQNFVLKQELKKEQTKYNRLLRAFNELIEEYKLQLDLRGEDTDSINEIWFEKAKIFD